MTSCPVLFVLINRLRWILSLKDFEWIEDCVEKKLRSITRRGIYYVAPLFYVSDQFVNFIKQCGMDLPLSISLITKHRMANSGIIVSLLGKYIDEHNLARSENNNRERFQPSQLMGECFDTTHLILKGKKFNEQYLNKLDSYKLDKIKERIAKGETSFLKLMETRTNGQGVQIYTQQDGYLFLGIMILCNRCRIPTEFVSDRQERDLKHGWRSLEANNLSNFLRRDFEKRRGLRQE